MYKFGHKVVLLLDGEDLSAFEITRNEQSAHISCARVPEVGEKPRIIDIHLPKGRKVVWTGRVTHACSDRFTFAIDKAERPA